jgi:TPR repeat protein
MHFRQLIISVFLLSKNGIAIAIDFVQAVKYYRLSAEQGNSSG